MTSTICGHVRMVPMTCLLCTSPAVADCLCVACGAKLWACELWRDEPKKAAKMFTDLLGAEGTYDTGSVERDTALLEMTPGPRRIEREGER